MHIVILVPATESDAPTARSTRVLYGLASAGRYLVDVLHQQHSENVARAPAVDLFLRAERATMPLPKRAPLPDLQHVQSKLRSLDRPDQIDAPDIIVDLGAGAASDDLAALARHGLWRMAEAPEKGPVAATMSGAPAMEVVLTRTPADGSPARRVASATYDTKPLASHSSAYAAEKSAQLLLREIARCERDGAPADLGPADACDDQARPAIAGYVMRILGEASKRARHKVARRLGRIPETFRLRIGRGTAEAFDPATAIAVPMPAAGLWADPFLIDYEGETYCFFEDLDVATGKGHISVGRVAADGLKDVRVALRCPHHMSYPFVFWHRGELLMMPEVHAAGRLEIWRCTGFPDQWELYSTALEGTPVADSVLLEHDGAWWLFTHISRDQFGDFCSDLHIFRVDGPELKRLEPHRLNPVVTDVATARGGGRVHSVGDRLLRMSQDNSGGFYGYGLNVMEILRLDLDGYEERRIRHITPDFAPGLIGCHHIDAANGWFVIDVRHA